MTEWRTVPGHPDYEVSDDGQARSSKRKRSPKLLTPSLKGKYYLGVYVDGKSRYLHQLIAAAFHGPRPEGLVVRHLDGDCTNNHADNLIYGSHQENIDDRKKHGSYGWKLTERKVRIIRGLYDIGFKPKRLCQIFSVGPNCIHDIVRRTTWSHI